MCGIIGYIGEKNCSEVLLEGLKRLEYRGYDSAGIALLNGNSVEVFRSRGNLSKLEELLGSISTSGFVGIGHTRWATHGVPSKENAHPHRDCSGKIAIVHNGIIENYAELKNLLISKGHKFVSETDSEVIAHLIEENYEGNLQEAILRTIPRLDGAYAIAAISKDEPDCVIGIRKDSPLIVGIGDNENFLASAIPAVLPYTNKVIFLEEGDLVKISKSGVRIISTNENKEAQREISRVEQNLDDAEKGGYPDFMLKEIKEQPQAVADTLRGKIQPDNTITINELRMSKKDLAEIDKIIFVACGTSYHAALVGKYVFENWAGIATEVEVASEFRYGSTVITDKTLVIAISQSGETADTLAGVRKAADRGARVAAIVNVVGSMLSKEAQAVIYTHAGLEICVAATKTFLAQLTAVYLLALYFAKSRGAIGGERYNRLLSEMKVLPQKIEMVFKKEDQIKELAERYADVKSFLYLGRGVGYPVALEGALKLKEISYIHAEGYPAGEMKHGPIALLDLETPVMAIAAKSAVRSKMLSNIEEAKARSATCLAVATEGDKEIAHLCGSNVVYVPETDEFLSPMIVSVVMQLFAYYLAKKKGCNVDQPRNLAKSVTVE